MPETTNDHEAFKDWCVLVGDGARARFLGLEAAGSPDMESGPNLVELKNLVNPEFDTKDEQVLSDLNSGRGRAAGGGPTHAYDDHRDRRREEIERRFARTIAAEAAALVQNRRAGRLVVAAPKKMLGYLRPEIAKTVKDGVAIRELGKDVTRFRPLELHRYLADEDLLPPRRPPGLQPGDATPVA